MRYLTHRICSWLAIGAASFFPAKIPASFAASPFGEVSIAAGACGDAEESADKFHTVEFTVQVPSESARQPTDSNILSDIRLTLPSVAFPSGPIQNCQDIANLIRSAQQSHCLELALKKTLAFCNADTCSSPLQRQLAHTLASRIEDERIKKGLTAHIVVYSTMILARQHNEAFDKLDQYEQQQKLAIENGIPIQDPLALRRIRIQMTDTAIQTIGANKNTRSQLSILTKNDLACGYQPTLEACCTAPLQDLCELITLAEQNRAELEVLRILDAMLCEQTTESCDCCASILNSLSVVAVPSNVHSDRFLSKIFGKSKIEAQTQALRSAIQAAAQIVRDRVASEVTDAWHKSASNQARLVLAREMSDAASQRVSQLQNLSAEVSSSPESLIDADLAAYKARGELVQREQEWQISLIDLAFSTGCL
jgi:hypothetical protein